MNPQPDLLLTLLVMSPGLIVGAVAAYMLWLERPKKRRRLTDDEVRRLYPAIASRVRAGRWD